MKTLSLSREGIVIGEGSLEYLSKVPSKRAVIVTGRHSMMDAGIIPLAIRYLESAGSKVQVYPGICKNPSSQEIMRGVEMLKKENLDLVVAIGGGSAIDAAKAMTFFLEFPDMGFDNIENVVLPQVRKKIQLIAVPSTSGTGTELTHISMYTDLEKKTKIALKSMALKPDIAILDVRLTMIMPANIVAETGLDALAHALEAYTNPELDSFTEVMAKGAIEGLITWLPESFEKGSIESREKVHYYQAIAGVAFSNVGLGMVHGVSHAFGAIFNLGHGMANGIILPYAMEYNGRESDVAKKFDYLSGYFQGRDMVLLVRDLRERLKIPSSFYESGLDEEIFLQHFEEIVNRSMQGPTLVNPVKISKGEMGAFVKLVYYGK